MIFLLTDFLREKLKLKNIHDTLIILFYVSPRSPHLQRLSFSIKKHTHKERRTAAVDPWHLKVEIAD